MPGNGNASAPADRTAVVGLILLGLLPVAGRFASPTLGWGFHLTGYLPWGAWLAALAGWGLLFVPPWRRLVDRLLYERLGRALFGPSARRAWLTASALALAAFGVFWLLTTPTRLLGDGVLVSEMVGKGARFRATDGMDFLLHRLARDAIAPAGGVAAAVALYAWGSRLAGLLGLLGAVLLLRRTRLPIPTRVLLLLLWLLSAPTLLYCGYVESYGFLSVALLGFTWSGAMAERGEASPWLPGVCFGLALFLHSTALLALPALLWLALRRGPVPGGRRRRVAALVVPAVLLPLAAVLAHVALGFDEIWFRREFLDSSNQRSLLIALTGEHSLLSAVHWKDVGNWVLLAIPVPAWLVLARMARLRRKVREPEMAFVLVQAASLALALAVLDRKLGSARDWDLFAAHVAGLGWLAARLWEPEATARPVAGPWPGLRFAAPWVALLVAWPWFAVNASRDAALARFTEIRGDFGAYPRAYATQDLAKYYREHDAPERALALYEECVREFPRNARFRGLLATSCLAAGRVDEARRQFDEALGIDPSNQVVLGMRAKLALDEADAATALALYRRQALLAPADPDAWAGVGLAASRLQRLEEARDALARAADLAHDPRHDYWAGAAAAALGRWDEAIERFRGATRDGREGLYYFGLAMALEAREAARVAAGGVADRASLEAARGAAARAAELAPQDTGIAGYRDHITRVVAGRVPARIVSR